jgi:hypothetical protein
VSSSADFVGRRAGVARRVGVFAGETISGAGDGASILISTVFVSSFSRAGVDDDAGGATRSGEGASPPSAGSTPSVSTPSV